MKEPKRIKELKLISIQDVLDRTAIRGRAAIYRLVSENRFPAPVRLSPRRVAWDSAAIDRWIAARIADSEANGWRDESAKRIASIANARSVAVRAAQREAERKESEAAKPKRGRARARKVLQEGEAGWER